MAFSKPKALFRQAAERMSTAVDGLWPNIGRLVDSGPPIECANFFAGVGYEPDLTETALTTRLV